MKSRKIWEESETEIKFKRKKTGNEESKIGPIWIFSSGSLLDFNLLLNQKLFLTEIQNFSTT